MHGDALAEPAAAERENPIDQRTTALACGHDAIEVASQPAAPGCVAQRHLAIAEDRAENVVEVVRDPAGERAHRLQSLRQAQLLLEPPALGDVVEKDSDAPELRVFDAERVNVIPASELLGFVFEAHRLARQRDLAVDLEPMFFVL